MDAYAASGIDFDANIVVARGLAFALHMDIAEKHVEDANKEIAKYEFDPHNVYTTEEYANMKKMAAAALRGFKEIGFVMAECNKFSVILVGSYKHVIKCLDSCMVEK